MEKMRRIKNMISKTRSMRDEDHENLYEFITQNDIPTTMDNHRVYINFEKIGIDDTMLNNLEQLISNIHDRRI